MNEARAITVRAKWDPEAGVWVATSEDVPGLSTEATTAAELEDKLREIIPILLELNHVGTAADHRAVPLSLLLHQEKILCVNGG